jgi:hypothetical protein
MKSENIAKAFLPKSEVKKIAKTEIAEGLEEYKKPDAENGPADNKADDYNGLESENKQDTNIPEGLINADEFKEKNYEEMYQIYNWYANAISRRDREPLEEDRFIAHFFEGGSLDTPYMFGNSEKGYLLGYSKYGVFIPTHFAPKSMRKGYELMKELGASEKIPAVMSITEDLVETIKKMPEWHAIDLSFLSEFRNGDIEKRIVHNSNPEVHRLMYALLYDYLNEHK